MGIEGDKADVRKKHSSTEKLCVTQLERVIQKLDKLTERVDAICTILQTKYPEAEPMTKFLINEEVFNISLYRKNYTKDRFVLVTSKVVKKLKKVPLC